MTNYNMYTKLKGKRKVTIEKIVGSTLEWCIEKWGLNGKRKSLLEIELDWDSKEGPMGEYDYQDNLILIYPRNNVNIMDLVDSVIHEFTHQRQKMSKYNKVLKGVGYNDHPMEIEAYEVAKVNRKECWYEIKKKL